MDIELKKTRINPIVKANPLSKLLLIWVWSIFKEGFSRPLTKDDMYDAPPEDQANDISQRLQENWDKIMEVECQNETIPRRLNGYDERHPEQRDHLMGAGCIEMEAVENGQFKNDQDGTVSGQKGTKKPEEGCWMIIKALLGTFGYNYFAIWPMLIFTDCCLRVIQPWFLLQLIRSFIRVSRPESSTDQYLYATGIVISTLMLTIVNNPIQLYLDRLGLRIRIALSSLLQRKMMKISQCDDSKADLNNLVANDAAKMEKDTIHNIPYIFLGPIIVGIFMYFLSEEFGLLNSFAGIGFVVFFVFFQFWNGTLSAKYAGLIGQTRDKRMKVLTETISGMNTIKLYAWENIFENIVGKARRLEVKELSKRLYLHAFFMSIFFTSSRVAPFLTYMAFVLSGGPLTADRVFYAAAVFNMVTHFLGFLFPKGVRGVGEIIGATKRIQAFMLLPEKRAGSGYKHEKNATEPSISLQSANGIWPEFALQNLGLDIGGDKLVAVVGMVGSGKSSFLQMLLGELPLSKGKCTVRGKMSYASQVPWIFDGTIRQNILFGEEFNQERYDKAIEMSALTADLKLQKNGDMTRVGDRALSGGQKARLSLARALYRDANIYLLDNPLSAVDSKVSRFLFDECFKKHLKGRLRILVTHQHQYLKSADYIISFFNGILTHQGTYDEISQRDPEFFENLSQSNGSDVDTLVGESQAIPVECTEKNYETEDLTKEVQLAGTIGLHTYSKYFKSADSICQFWWHFFMFLLSQLFTTVIELWLASWTNYEAQQALKMDVSGDTMSLNSGAGPSIQNGSDLESEQLVADREESTLTTYIAQNGGTTFYLYIYTGLTVAVFLTNLGKAVGFYNYCIKVCKNVHRRMLSSLVRATPQFFDDNPSGRIINRYAKDIAVFDEQIPLAFFDMWTIYLQIGTVLSLIIFGNYFTLVAIVPFCVSLWFIRRYYVTTSRELKRIDGIARSPIYSHLMSAFNGRVIVRAFETQEKIADQFNCLQDDHTSAATLFLAANRCFDIWIETIATILLALVTFGFLLAQDYWGMTFQGGYVGLALSGAMSLTIWLQYGMRTSADVENLMISVERAFEYTKLTSEAALEIPGEKPNDAWPAKGNISFIDVSLAYVENGEKKLRNLNFEVEAGQKIGIVGRTGAGKSTIFRALFRMTEPTGTINVDEVTINSIGLHDLRKSVTIIPQEPVLFNETLRFNLEPDPSNKISDYELNRALKQVNLDKPLDAEITAGGGNLGVGERQLVSLARALLKKNKIVALDEATAHIDPKTDEHIQNVLREKLEDCTVLTIAHRLETVIQSDKILVMQDGQRKEYDAPYILLQDPKSALSSMVDATGTETAKKLREKAKEAYSSSPSPRP